MAIPARQQDEAPTEPDLAAPRRRTGGRSANVRRRVHEAMRQLLVEGDGQAITIAQVAERSGVHATTIYRRWGDALNLRTEVGLEIAASQMPVLDTGALATDLLAFARQAISFVATPTGHALVSGLLVVGPERRRSYWAQRFAVVRQPFERAVARGELADDARVDEALANFTGALYFRVLFSGQTLDTETTARELVAVALRTVGAPVPTTLRLPR